jgi:hypothetical protein
LIASDAGSVTQEVEEGAAEDMIAVEEEALDKMTEAGNVSEVVVQVVLNKGAALPIVSVTRITVEDHWVTVWMTEVGAAVVVMPSLLNV